MQMRPEGELLLKHSSSEIFSVPRKLDQSTIGHPCLVMNILIMCANRRLATVLDVSAKSDQ